MGERAQTCLEELIPIFEQCQRVELFTPLEIKQVIKKCTKHEYKLNRNVKTSTKEPLAYAKYLEDFFKLIGKRRQRLDYQYQKTKIDLKICRKIESIYRIACERFKWDLNAWRCRLKFAKRRNMNSTVSRIYNRMLQVHTDKPSLWLQAAKWESEKNKSFENGRSLIHKALRFHSKTSNELWCQLFKLELLYVQNLLERKALLSESRDEKKVEEAAWKSEATDDVMKLELAKIVAKEALEARPLDMQLYMDLHSTTSVFTFATDLQTWLLDTLSQAFPRAEEVLMLNVNKHIQMLSPDKNAIERDQIAFDMIDEAIGKVDTLKMKRMALDFCKSLHESNYSLTPETVKQLRMEKVKEIYKMINDENSLDENDFLQWSRLDSEEEVDMIHYAIKKLPKSCKLWIQLLELTVMQDTSHKSILKLFNRAFKYVDEKDSEPLWRSAIVWACAKCPEQVESLFRGASAQCTTVSDSIGELELEWLACACLPADQLTKSIKQLVTRPPHSLKFYELCIEMLESCPEPPIKRIRSTFEAAILEYGTDSPNLWMKYAEFEMQNDQLGDQNKTPAVYHRAVRTLDEQHTDMFVMLWTKHNNSC